MVEITNEYMMEMISKSKNYSVVILRKTDKFNEPEVQNILYLHGKRNFQLREDGILSVVCRINDESDVSGVGIFNANIEEVKSVMDDDPGVKAGIFTYDVHMSSSFPGDKLP